MGCGVSREQLWSWIDRDAAELDEHLAACPDCRALAAELQAQIGLLATPLPFSAPPLPEKIGSYVVKRLIGEGGQARVYEAEQENPRRRIALKVLRGGSLADRRQISQFQREIQTLARLHCPSIVTIHEAGCTVDGQYFIVMELVEGQPLDRYVAEVDLSLTERIELCRRICVAVQYAHNHEVIHCDLKPSNILVQADGTPRILDFGLARLTQSDLTPATRSCVIEGTPRYMSPEQIRGRLEELDHRTDVYALGVLFFEVLTGESPFAVDALNPETLQVVARENPKRAGQINSELRGDLEAILGKALEVDPNRRYASVRALDDDLRRHLEGKSISVRPASTLHRWRRRLWKRRVAVGVGFVIACLTAAATWQLTGSWSDRENAQRQLRVLHAQLLVNPHVAVLQGMALSSCNQHPDLLESLLLRAQVIYFQDHALSAVRDLKTRMPDKPDSWPCHVLLAEIHSAQGDTTEASLQWASVLPLPDRADTWLRRSLAMLETSSALGCLREALRCDSTHIPALEQQQALLDASGDLLGAVACARRLVVLGERPAWWIRYEAEAQFKLGDMPEALAAYDRLARVDRLTAGDYKGRAQVERLMLQYDRAYEDLCSAILLADNPETTVWYFFFRGTVQWIRGYPDEAVKDYKETSRLLGQPTCGNVRAAIILMEQRRYGEAESLLRSLLASSRTELWLRQIAACIAGDIQPDSLVRAVDRDDQKGFCEACYYAGEACLASGAVDQAMNWFRRCIETGLQADPDSPLDPMSEYELAAWRLRESPGSPGHTRQRSWQGSGREEEGTVQTWWTGATRSEELPAPPEHLRRDPGNGQTQDQPARSAPNLLHETDEVVAQDSGVLDHCRMRSSVWSRTS